MNIMTLNGKPLMYYLQLVVEQVHPRELMEFPTGVAYKLSTGEYLALTGGSSSGWEFLDARLYDSNKSLVDEDQVD